MKLNDPIKVLAWLQQRPSAHDLHAAFPAEWEAMEQELQTALATRDTARLHRLLHPSAQPENPETRAKSALNKREKQDLVRAAIRQRMAALAIERHGLAIATGRTSGKVRFNLFNGWLAQRLLFRRDLERKPVSLRWFKLLWPLVWQKRLLMPLVERKGIYCFYSLEFVRRLGEMIGSRRCLEIAAGDGTLSRFLHEQGVAVTATDDYSWQDRIAFPSSVERLEAGAALRQYQPQVVLCSWPPAQNSFEREVFRTGSVELYIAVVSAHRFASGNWADYDSQQAFTVERRPDLARLLLPPELGCEVLVFRRQPQRTDCAVSC